MKCTECDKEFNSEEGLQHHRQAKHSVAKNKFTLKKKYYWYAGAAVMVALLGIWLYSTLDNPGKYDALAQCIGEKGATFYGAFWCPHCGQQKQLFGKSAKLLPYIECSTPDGRGQTAICISKKIDGYPTWEFADGSRMSAIMSPQQLADKVGCSLE
ncbi:MAG: hypothetical protein Q8R47_05970 [Nanoarchaeota archaeon]|nr:hypothetical protein [Nanoarchaeota archaeon]